ncbi:hypothetical protein SDC9_202757 [bioreactor metagenome]|uniref:Uncharacterized protein n=1 Tax=bioreactor metagenome TaxID=1076179 RepID=A0A645IUI5_9ZZZZ
MLRRSILRKKKHPAAGARKQPAQTKKLVAPDLAGILPLPRRHDTDTPLADSRNPARMRYRGHHKS